MVSLFNLSWPSFLGIAELLAMDLFKANLEPPEAIKRVVFLEETPLGLVVFFQKKNTIPFKKVHFLQHVSTAKKTSSQEFFGGRKL